MSDSRADARLEARIARGKQYCLRLYKAGPHLNQPEEEADRIQREHLRYGFQLYEQGKVLLFGPVPDDPVLKGMAIYATMDAAEVKALCDADPAVRAGRLVYEVYSWFGVPGDGLPL